jgi:hypothetical protein
MATSPKSSASDTIITTKENAETLNNEEHASTDQRGAEIEWHGAIENLLCEEAEKCAGLAWLHGKSEIYFSKQHNYLQIPVIILSTVVGAVSVGSASLFAGATEIASVVLGGVSILVSILGLLNTHYAFSKRAEGHKIGCVQYAQIYRMILIEMALPRPQRMPPKQVLRYIKDDLKRLMETLPRVPENVIDMYKKEIIPTSSDVSHPDITNGVHRVVAFVDHERKHNHTPSHSPTPQIKIRILDNNHVDK